MPPALIVIPNTSTAPLAIFTGAVITTESSALGTRLRFQFVGVVHELSTPPPTKIGVALCTFATTLAVQVICVTSSLIYT